MQKIIKAVAVMGITATLGACASPAQEEEVVFVPVQPEPVTGKF